MHHSPPERSLISDHGGSGIPLGLKLTPSSEGVRNYHKLLMLKTWNRVRNISGHVFKLSSTYPIIVSRAFLNPAIYVYFLMMQLWGIPAIVRTCKGMMLMEELLSTRAFWT
ncbi:hypothetical protein TIFTF001_035060 [Ficus carica]|uniref:Uncharacterized protein n=1 Tax=Ficus carica TaxID=3494 RepID=A0AA88E1J3_FICCA|nr:hypothetical protein TIFTF001_035038 [Ficus carica]GMN65985.1 hypothetical protein TIFTF001_035060 [Ficus carica]